MNSNVARFTTVLFMTILSCHGCKTPPDGLMIKFPEVSEPVAITSGPAEHLFATYYGINSWSADQRYVTVLETPIKHRLPTENDSMSVARRRLRQARNTITAA